MLRSGLQGPGGFRSGWWVGGGRVLRWGGVGPRRTPAFEEELALFVRQAREEAGRGAGPASRTVHPS